MTFIHSSQTFFFFCTPPPFHNCLLQTLGKHEIYTHAWICTTRQDLTGKTVWTNVMYSILDHTLRSLGRIFRRIRLYRAKTYFLLATEYVARDGKDRAGSFGPGLDGGSANHCSCPPLLNDRVAGKFADPNVIAELHENQWSTARDVLILNLMTQVTGFSDALANAAAVLLAIMAYGKEWQAIHTASFWTKFYNICSQNTDVQHRFHCIQVHSSRSSCLNHLCKHVSISCILFPLVLWH